MSSTLMSATVDTKSGVSVSAPMRVFDLKPLRINPSQWQALPDGRIVAVQMGAGDGDITSFTFVLNWFDDLRDRMRPAPASRLRRARPRILPRREPIGTPYGI